MCRSERKQAALEDGDRRVASNRRGTVCGVAGDVDAGISSGNGDRRRRENGEVSIRIAAWRERARDASSRAAHAYRTATWNRAASDAPTTGKDRANARRQSLKVECRRYAAAKPTPKMAENRRGDRVASPEH